jgi:hypothetical protein
MNTTEIRAKLMDAEAILMYLSKAEELLGQDSPEVLLATLAEKARALVADASESLEQSPTGA